MNKEHLQVLIDDLRENQKVEIKNWLGGLKDNSDKAKLAKEIIAIANYGGGDIFIGFEDDRHHAEILPGPEELEAFTQDNIASLVNKYLEPPIQCEVVFLKKSGSANEHPVIIVPGGHKTPIWAKKGSPDNTTLICHQLYLRRPGGNSEPPRSPDDWENFLNMLVSNRQEELLDAMRNILNSNSNSQIESNLSNALDEWKNEIYGVWRALVQLTPKDSPVRLDSGHYFISFQIEGFNVSSLIELRDFVMDELRLYSGLAPFLVPSFHQNAPQIIKNRIQYWGARNDNASQLNNEFWSIDEEGKGFVLSQYQEDLESFLENRSPKSNKMFGFTLNIYRIGERLKAIEELATKFSFGKGRIDIALDYKGAKGRTLVAEDIMGKYGFLDVHKTADTESLQSTIKTSADQINLNLKEQVYLLLRPVYEQFDFANLRQETVDQVIDEMFR